MGEDGGDKEVGRGVEGRAPPPLDDKLKGVIRRISKRRRKKSV